MEVSISQIFGTDTGHRLARHEGKCRSAHGHRYTWQVTVVADSGGLDLVGRVIDFSVMKTVIGGWLDRVIDHGFIVESTDPLRAAFEQDAGTKLLVVGFPPSIENLVRYVFEGAQDALNAHTNAIRIVHVRGYETPNCYADYPYGFWPRSSETA